jgi:nitrogen fixation NifU-like protein
MSLNRLQQLYRSVIVDAAGAPTRFGQVPDSASAVHAVNPTCGDVLDLAMAVDDAGVITGVAATATGCTISQASTALMVRAIRGQTTDSALAQATAFQQMVRDDVRPTVDLGDARALQSVHAFPARVKCALLAWTTLTECLQNLAEGGADDATDKQQQE